MQSKNDELEYVRTLTEDFTREQELRLPPLSLRMDEARVKGVKLGLTPDQVQATNFGVYTTGAIQALIATGGFTVADAYERLITLEEYKVCGIALGLTLEQVVDDPNFGPHTTGAIQALIATRGFTVAAAYESLSALEVDKVCGIALGLTPEEVQADNFSFDTIDAILYLQDQKSGLSGADAYKILSTLEEYKVCGIALGLTPEEVQADNFGFHTVNAMKDFLDEKPELSVDDAYSRFCGLKEDQVLGIAQLGLTREQVEHPDFGAHTIAAIQASIATNRGLPVAAAYDHGLAVAGAYKKLITLEEYKLVGTELGLTLKQMEEDPKFGTHTIAAIQALTATNHDLSVADAYKSLCELNDDFKVCGIALGLTPEQLEDPKLPTNIAIIVALRKASPDLRGPAVYETVSGLNDCQVYGIMRFKLNCEQVQAPNFGDHTINGIRDLTREERGLSVENAYLRLRGLEHVQVIGVVNYGLTPDQVQAHNFGVYTIAGILSLRAKDPELSVTDAYETVCGLEDFQVRGITDYGLTRKQVEDPDFRAHTLEENLSHEGGWADYCSRRPSVGAKGK